MLQRKTNLDMTFKKVILVVPVSGNFLVPCVVTLN